MANRYWVGGTGTWDTTTTTHWSATNGGAGGASVPTSSDNVYFTSSSNATSYTVNLDTGGGSVCNDISIAGPASGSVTITGAAGNPALAVYGSFTHAASGVVWSQSNITTFKATTTGKIIQTNGFVFNCLFVMDGVGGGWSLVDNFTVVNASFRSFTLTNGALSLNNKVLKIGALYSNNSNTRSIDFGTGWIEVDGNGRPVDFRTTTNLTLTGSKLIKATYSGSVGTRNIEVGPTSKLNAINLMITAGSDTISSTYNCSYTNLDFTGFSGTWNPGTDQTIYGDITISSGMSVASGTQLISFSNSSGNQTITTNGKTIDHPIAFNGSGTGSTCIFADSLTQGSTRAFTITNGTVQLKAGTTSTVGVFATSGTNQKYLQSTLAGSQATISQASGTVNASYLTVKDINATGGATWNAYRSLNNIDAGNNTGWDFLSTPVTTTTLSVRLGLGL